MTVWEWDCEVREKEQAQYRLPPKKFPNMLAYTPVSIDSNKIPQPTVHPIYICYIKLLPSSFKSWKGNSGVFCRIIYILFNCCNCHQQLQGSPWIVNTLWKMNVKHKCDSGSRRMWYVCMYLSIHLWIYKIAKQELIISTL